MKTRAFLLSLTVLLSMIGMTSCKKPGCNQENACNFDADAKTNDGTCINKGQVTFWQSGAGNGYDVVVTVNATDATITSQLTTTPLCDASGCATFSLCPGTHSYSAHEVLPGIKAWNGSAVSSEDGCMTIMLD